MVNNALKETSDEQLRQFVPNCHFELIRICDLVSNQEYQRNLSILLVKSAVQEFDLHQINPVKVSRRDGTNYVYDGQHTVEIVAAASGSRLTPVWCMVYDDLNYEEEAGIFANQQRHKKNLTPYEVFKANVEAGKDKQLLIRDLLATYGLYASPTKANGGVCAIGTVEKIYDKYGFETLNRVFQLIVATWEGDHNSFSSSMLTGVARVVDAYQDKLRDNVFAQKLGTISPKEIIRNARERRSGSLGFAEVMVQYYNKKCKYGLPYEALHSSRGRPPEFIAADDAEQEAMELDTPGENGEELYASEDYEGNSGE